MDKGLEFVAFQLASRPFNLVVVSVTSHKPWPLFYFSITTRNKISTNRNLMTIVTWSPVLQSQSFLPASLWVWDGEEYVIVAEERRHGIDEINWSVIWYTLGLLGGCDGMRPKLREEVSSSAYIVSRRQGEVRERVCCSFSVSQSLSPSSVDCRGWLM